MTATKRSSLLVAIAAAAVCAPAFANGGDFFEELSATWQTNADEGVPYFGFVRDGEGTSLIPLAAACAQMAGDEQTATRALDLLAPLLPNLARGDSKGKVIPSAAVTATTASGSSFVVQADNMGHYRIPGFSKSVDAKLVQVTCSKPGYRLVARDRRILRGVAKAPIETNCILAPNTGKPAA